MENIFLESFGVNWERTRTPDLSGSRFAKSEHVGINQRLVTVRDSRHVPCVLSIVFPFHAIAQTWVMITVYRYGKNIRFLSVIS